MFKLSSRTKIKLINFYPPYMGAGIKVTYISSDIRKIVVKLKMRWWNKNLFGTHFGGSLASLTDPFYVFIIMQNLGRGYIVWDKSSKINFRKPGVGTVHCTFELSDQELTDIKEQVDQKGKLDVPLKVEVFDSDNELVCDVEKVVYVRRR